MRIIGLTGGIGSGKSTVAQFLAELGAVVIDTDKIGHQLLAESAVRRSIIDSFGEHIVAAGGGIDRKCLAEIVFSSPQARKKLEDILHPAILDSVKRQIGELERQGIRVVVLEVPLLIEAGWLPYVDEVWVTTAPRSTVLRRLKENKGIPEQETLARINSQLSTEERVKHADVIIDTDCPFEELKPKVQGPWQRVQEGLI